MTYLDATEFTIPQQGTSTNGAPPAGSSTPGPATGPGPGAGTLADGTPSGAAQGSPAGCGTEQLLLLLGMFAIMYFLLIRPQQKQEKQRKAMVNALKKGDSVVMNSGLHGVIDAIDESTVTIRADRDVQLTFDRVAIARSGAAAGDAPETADTDAK